MRQSLDSRSVPYRTLGAVSVACLLLGACADSRKVQSSRVDARLGVSASPRVVQPGQPVPKGGGSYRVGRPYVVAGRTYYPQENRRYRAEGIASWYGTDFHGRLTANGEVYDMEGLSAAHPTMPMPSYARVTNLHNGRSIVVRVNDRGPYHNDRVIDLSSKTAEVLALRRSGIGRVRVEYVGPASLAGSNDRRLMATLREGRPAPAPSSVRVASTRPFAPSIRSEAAVAPSRAAAPRPHPSYERAMASRTIESEILRDSRPAVAAVRTQPPAASYAPSSHSVTGLGRGLY